MNSSARIVPTHFAALHHLLKIARNQRAEEKYHPPEDTRFLQAYLSHGILSVAEALSIWNEHRGLTLNDHLCQRVLQFEYVQHIWRHRGDAIFNDIQKRPQQIRYHNALPADISMAASGVGPIDRAIRQLYQTGLISPVQQQWIAGYVVHMRKIDWRSGARWMYGHLLDGDLASVFLDWQKIAGTLGQPPIVFNAAAMLETPDQALTETDTLNQPLDVLLRLADSSETILAEPVRPLPQREPRLQQHPSAAWTKLNTVLPPLAGQDVTLVHPWSVAPRRRESLSIGIIHLPFHLRFPWSETRWRFVLEGMAQTCDALWIGDLAHCRQWLADARTVCCLETRYPCYGEALGRAGVSCLAPEESLPEPGHLCASFEIYLQAIRRHRPELFETSLKGQVARLQRRNEAAAKPSAPG